MNEDEIRSAFLEIIGQVAPGEDLTALDATRSYRDQFEIDSLEFLRLVARVHERFGIDVPESDYRRVETVDGAVSYIAAHGASNSE